MKIKTEQGVEEKRVHTGSETLRAVLEGRGNDLKPKIKIEPQDMELDAVSLPAENEVIVKTEVDDEKKPSIKMEVEEVSMEVCNEVEIGTTEEEVKTEEIKAESDSTVSRYYFFYSFFKCLVA